MLGSILALGIHLGTYHTNIDTDYIPNNSNPGIYVETKDNYMVGMYYNSDRKSTIYVGKALHYGRASLMVGVATGYNKPLVPAIIPAYNVPLANGIEGKIWYVPKVDTGAEAVHFSIEWRIK
jgi:hypothetical protein